MREMPQSSSDYQCREDLRRATQLAEEALALCDRQDFAFAAISLCQALEKLKALEVRSAQTNG